MCVSVWGLVPLSTLCAPHVVLNGLLYTPSCVRRLCGVKWSLIYTLAPIISCWCVAGPLGVTHLINFTKTDVGTNMRVARLPRGPTLTFRVKAYDDQSQIVASLPFFLSNWRKILIRDVFFAIFYWRSAGGSQPKHVSLTTSCLCFQVLPAPRGGKEPGQSISNHNIAPPLSQYAVVPKCGFEMCFAPSTFGKTRLHTPRAVTYHEQYHTL